MEKSIKTTTSTSYDLLQEFWRTYVWNNCHALPPDTRLARSAWHGYERSETGQTAFAAGQPESVARQVISAVGWAKCLAGQAVTLARQPESMAGWAISTEEEDICEGVLCHPSSDNDKASVMSLSWMRGYETWNKTHLARSSSSLSGEQTSEEQQWH